MIWREPISTHGPIVYCPSGTLLGLSQRDKTPQAHIFRGFQLSHALSQLGQQIGRWDSLSRWDSVGALGQLGRMGQLGQLGQLGQGRAFTPVPAVPRA